MTQQVAPAGARESSPLVEFTLTPEARKALELVQEPNCQMCVHFRQCKYVEPLVNFAKSMCPKTEKDEPDWAQADFQPFVWANVCKSYLPMVAVKVDPSRAMRDQR